MLTIASAPAASAAPSIKPKASVTGTVTPVRLTLTGSTPDVVPYAGISWTTSAALTTTDTVVLTLTTAPSSAARLALAPVGSRGLSTALSSGTFSSVGNFAATGYGLGAAQMAGTGVAGGTGYSFSAAGTAALALAVTQAGPYAGTIATFSGGVAADTVSFSFSTTGAPTSMTLTPATQSVSVNGTATMVATLLGSNGLATQPQIVDSVATAASPTTGGSPSVPSVGTGGALSTDFYDGVANVTFAPTAANTYTVTVTPQGTLPVSGVTAQSVTVTASGSISTLLLSDITVTSPATTTPAGTQPSTTANIPAGTSSVAVTVTGNGSAVAGQVVRLKGSASAGTPSASSPQYVNVTLDADLEGTATFTLGGDALLDSATFTVVQVDASNTNVAGPAQVVLTQATRVASTSTIAVSPSGSTVRQLGAITPVTVTVLDQFASPMSGFAVRSYRSATAGTGFLNVATTGADGTAVVNVSGATGITTGTVEQYSFRATSPSGTNYDKDAALSIEYTTSGGVTSISVAASGTGSTTFTNSAPTIATGPYINTPTINGYVNDGGGALNGSWNFGATTPAQNTARSNSYATFTPTTVPANSTTVTVPAGVRVSLTAPTSNTTLYSAGSQSVVVANATPVYVWGTAVGDQNITFESGGLTVTGKLRIANDVTKAYNIALSPASQSLETGAFGTAVLTVTDMFGNPVNTSAGGMDVTMTAAGAVRLAGGATTSTTTQTGSAGTFTVALVAANAAGAATLTATPTGTSNAWASAYVPPAGVAAPVKSATQAITVTSAVVPVPTTLTWGTVPASVNAGSITTLEGTLKDQNGAVMDNQDVNIVITGSATIGTSGIKTGQVTTNAAGKFFVGALAGASGTFTVTATADTNALATATTSTVTITAAPTPATITILPAGGGVVPSSVEAGSSVPMVATVKDTTGAAEANEAVEVSITGNATFANGNTQYVANTGASGTLGFTVIAGASGTFTVTATVVSAPAVKASAGPITITPAPVDKTITIMGGRGQGADPVPSGETCRSIAEAGEELPDRCIMADGETTGFSTGSAMTPEFRFPGQTSYSPGTAVNTDADGEFDWFRRTGKKIYVKFSSDGVESNRIIIDAR